MRETQGFSQGRVEGPSGVLRRNPVEDEPVYYLISSKQVHYYINLILEYLYCNSRTQ